MKIIFLDIDGVLNSETDFLPEAIKYDPVHSKLQKGEKWKIISAGKLALLNRIVRETDAKIVLSSTWRFACDAKKLTKIFQRYGNIWEHPSDIIIGKTPDWRRPGENWQAYRDREIYQYIEENNVTEYIILDDNSEIRKGYRFIQINEYHGLSILQMYRAIKELGRTPKYQRRFDREQLKMGWYV